METIIRGLMLGITSVATMLIVSTCSSVAEINYQPRDPIRYYDVEADVICYQIPGAAIDCMPRSQTNLSIDEALNVGE